MWHPGAGGLGQGTPTSGPQEGRRVTFCVQGHGTPTRVKFQIVPLLLKSFFKKNYSYFLGCRIPKCPGRGPMALGRPPGPRSSDCAPKGPGWEFPTLGPFPRVPHLKVPGAESSGPGEASPAFLGQEALIEPLGARGGSSLPWAPFPGVQHLKVPRTGFLGPGKAFLGQEDLIGPLRPWGGSSLPRATFPGRRVPVCLGRGPTALGRPPRPAWAKNLSSGP